MIYMSIPRTIIGIKRQSRCSIYEHAYSYIVSCIIIGIAIAIIKDGVTHISAIIRSYITPLVKPASYIGSPVHAWRLPIAWRFIFNAPSERDSRIFRIVNILAIV